jgi:hypothetical protein
VSTARRKSISVKRRLLFFSGVEVNMSNMKNILQ